MKRRLWRWGRLLVRTVQHFQADAGLDLSATVAFYSLLSLAPLLYVAGALLRWLFPDRNALERAISHGSTFFPPEVAEALDFVIGGIERGPGLVLVALPALIWVSSSAFSSLEGAVNVAFGTRQERSFVRSRLKGFGVIGAGLFILGTSIVANTLLPQLVRYRERLGLDAGSGALAGLSSWLGLLTISYLTVCLFYKFLPRGRVAWGAAARGALLALPLLELVRRLFGGFLLRSPAFGLLTGTLAGVVAFLSWVYFAVAVIILGAELAALLNGNRPRPEETP